MEKLDLKDKRIISELEENARQTNKQIGKKIGVNTDLVRYRIKRLEEEGIIKWFLTIINIAKIGYTDFGVYITTQKLTKEKEKEFTKHLIQQKHISYIAKLGGRYDFVIGLLAKDVLEFHQLLTNTLKKHEEFIVEKDIAIRLLLAHFPKKYLITKENRLQENPVFGGEIQQETLDETDQQILSELATKARVNVVNIAQKTNIPASTITQRIKKLKEKKVITGFFPIINNKKIQYQNYLVHIRVKNSNNTQENKLFMFCREHKNITYIIKTIGKWNYEIHIEVPNQETLQETLTQLREQILEDITNIEVIMLFEDIKYNLYPF